MRLFSLVVIVDWSASSTPGPPGPAPDRCWLAWGTARQRPEPEYFRTRHAMLARISRLLDAAEGAALLGFDFPFGYPSGSGLPAWRALTGMLARRIADEPSGRNNRFAVAAALNAALGAPPGPFWGCPPAAASPHLTVAKPSFAGRDFAERRLVEQRLEKRRIMTTWQLLGRGAVGGQMLLGLAAVHWLLQRRGAAGAARLWPFETGWDADLSGTVIAEMWPSLADHAALAWPVKDARQVAALRDWVLDQDSRGRLKPAFAAPVPNDPRLETEGWIVGA